MAEYELKNKDALAHEIGMRALQDADLLRRYMSKDFVAKFPIIWCGKRFEITVQMDDSDDK